MGLPARDMHDVTHTQSLRRLPFTTDKSSTHRYCQDLQDISNCNKSTGHIIIAAGEVKCTCPRSCVCQKVLAPGVKQTLFPMQSSAEKIGSMCTVPVKVSVGWREAVSGLWAARMSCMIAICCFVGR